MLFAEETDRICVEVCPGSTFNQNSTRQCKGTFLTSFADGLSKFCIGLCPAGSYGENSSLSCVGTCPLYLGIQGYAEDGNSICMKDCLADYSTFADPYSLTCVKICPISKDYYA